MAVKINIPTIEGMTLKTKGKYVADDIFMNVDIPKYDGSNENGVSVEDRLKKLLDTTKSAYYLFKDYSGTSVDDFIKYSDVENVTNMKEMFMGSDFKLINGRLEKWNPKNVTRIKTISMFLGCGKGKRPTWYNNLWIKK